MVLYVVYMLAKRIGKGASRYTRTMQGEVIETDLRLPYHRFKQLYPWSQMTYVEYKRLQMAKAFRKAVSSEKNKRMVR